MKSFTIECGFTLKRVRDMTRTYSQITTVFTKHEMKKLLAICTKNVHFSFNNNVYIQIDGVVIGPPSAQVLANVFIVELVNVLVHK